MINAFTVRAMAEQAGVPAVSAWIAWRWPFDQIFIPSAVLFMAFIGAAIWVFNERPGGSRARVYGLAICYAMVSAAIAVVITHLCNIDRGLAAPIALLIASGGRRMFNAFRDGATARARREIGGNRDD